MLYNKIKKSCAKVVKPRFMLPLLGLLALLDITFFTTSLAAVDELSGVMEAVKTNFGAGSTFVKLLYVAEIFAGGYAWHKTKSPAAVIGIVVLAVFMNYALGHWIG
jgi:hypothetical protein